MAVDRIERRNESMPAGRAAARRPSGRAPVLDGKTLARCADYADSPMTDERTGWVRTGSAPNALT
jgi:hypothetical protein